jgi:general secretion pathway protein D
MQGIPLLSEIPIIGGLFRFKSDERKRTNLMIFLRPVIIRAPEDAYRVTIDRYEYLRGYTRGEGPEREGIYDRMEPVQPAPTPLAPPRGSAPLAPPPAAPVSPAPQPVPAPATQ